MDGLFGGQGGGSVMGQQAAGPGPTSLGAGDIGGPGAMGAGAMPGMMGGADAPTTGLSSASFMSPETAQRFRSVGASLGAAGSGGGSSAMGMMPGAARTRATTGQPLTSMDTLLRLLEKRRAERQSRMPSYARTSTD